MARKLTRPEALVVRKALDDARSGQATLTQLAHAHDLAEDGCLSGCLGELRQHIRNHTPEPVSSPIKSAIGDLIIGAFAGVLTHHMLGD